MRHFLGVGARWRSRMPVRRSQRCALDIREGCGRRERWQIMSPHLRRRLEARRQLDQSWLAERRPEEADSQRNAVLRANRRLRW